ncbi:hypothetical protein C488_18665 [Natrinema pellirubrum DSM 15624]|uniref:Uncharacterized protein n=1 Tax=Natrinema pellirubrum (strain DSM 15624 / CIP 106293 / JCM 10476 / NCIMB 786 / 157) TaxID=797303 RepID=L0JS01_NATP1|nr:hypothetical protein [Natrinema pellirubrum]AGB33608.1 hypothetical protein Natpe_3849 [Natrinema pellirubrum DSM 15624]ELY70465.1 hypothetical protein C488_18665 [Natrinema pellirubrum DSM 15624]
MRRALAVGAGLLVIAVPDRIVAAAERLAFVDPDAGRLRPWTIPIARLKGAIVVWLLGRKRGSPSGLETGLAVVGLGLALFPRTALEVGLELAYENGNELEPKRWVLPVTRLLGIGYVAVALFPQPIDAPRDATTDGETREDR